MLTDLAFAFICKRASSALEDFLKFHFETHLLTPWSTYATNWNGLNNFDRWPPRDHSCEVWSKSNKRFQRRCCLRNCWRTHGRRTSKDHKISLSTLCSGEQKMNGSHDPVLYRRVLLWIYSGTIFYCKIFILNIKLIIEVKYYFFYSAIIQIIY